MSNIVSVFGSLDLVQTLTNILRTDPHLPGDFSERSLPGVSTVDIAGRVAPGDEARVSALAEDVRTMIRQRRNDTSGTAIRIVIHDNVARREY